MPRFSVVVPAYNSSATIRETLDAMLEQTFADWECVVVNDGSTDDTPQIVAEYAERDSRFVLVNQQNTGTAGAYRTGVAQASADLLAICASDDMLLPAHLATMDALIREHPDYDIYSCNGELLFHESGERRVVHLDEPWLSVRSLSFSDVIEACFFGVGAVFRREVFDRAEGYRPGVYVEDYDFWLRAMARGARHLYVPDVLSVHRLSPFQQSANAERVLESDIEVYENLIATEGLAPNHVREVQRSITRRRKQIAELRHGKRRSTIGSIARSLFGPRLARRLAQLADTLLGHRRAGS